MRVRIVGRKTDEVSRLATEVGLEVSDDGSDLMICHGGDGTLLGAEREFPGIPKLALRLDAECRKCPFHETRAVLERLAAGQCDTTEIIKLEARSSDRRLVSINDIILHNSYVFSAVRFKIWIGDELYSDELVGDGLVAATPFGSSGYYRSVTCSILRAGIGLAFNNTTEPIDHIVLNEQETVRIVITRGPAVLGADNDTAHIRVDEGDEIIIRKAPETATVLAMDTLLCNNCRRLDGRKWNRHGGLLTV